MAKWWFFESLVELLALGCVLRLGWLVWQQPRPVFKEAGVAFLGAYAWVYGSMLVDNWLAIWPFFGLDYSTHTAATLAGALFLSGRQGLRIAASLLLVAGYAIYMKAHQYHSYMDVITTTLWVAPMCLWINWKRLPRFDLN